MNEITLKGITWNHSRAMPPLVATAQRYEERNPGVRILWEKRTLHEFGHASLAQLADRYDLLVVDHPMMGEAEANLVNLKDSLGPDEYRHLRESYVGPSFQSYEYADALFALPIDAAAPAACFRPDLLDRSGRRPPGSWPDLFELASLGKVRMPGFPADLFLNWMGMCISQGSPRASDPEHLFSRDAALSSLEDLRALASWMPASIYKWNPIALYEAMAVGDDIAYCPFAYTYSNYSRRGFAANLLQFANPVSLSNGSPLRTVLGGTGVAVSKSCASLEQALRYARFVADPHVQRDLYGPAGGQPAARAAWDDPLLNGSTQDFFSATRQSVENAYIRPRYRGYIPLQEAAGVHLARYLQGQIKACAALDTIHHLYRESLPDVARMSAHLEAQTHA